ncbi:MAG: arginine--tRNA ligase [Patescibacteria group bacterium]|nr:arginine--tRNA ligase [Patescibacteria group bacterium]
MNKILQTKIQEILGLENLIFSTPPKAEMGDICFSAFEEAKKNGSNPVDVAKELAENFKTKISNFKLIDRVEPFGPYVNLFLNTSEVSKLILSEVNEDFGKNNIGQNKKVLIEYPSQNTHKEFHIGHFRNVCIGNTIVQVYRASGYDIIPMNYVNDFGRHVVKCLWGIKNSSLFDVSSLEIENTENKQKMLGQIYAKASNYLKDHDEDYKAELDDMQQKLESGEAEITKLFFETRKWSTDGFADLMQEMKVEHDSIIYESEVKSAGQKLVDELLDKKIAQVGEGGAIIADLNKYNLDIALLRKSTGGGVYMTSDLALSSEKFRRYEVEESINLTGSEQNFYFKQLYKILELSGFDNKMTHIGYGLVNLPSGKMSSRAGNVILYEELRDRVLEHLQKETKARHEDWDNEKVNTTAHTLTMAVLKFTMQKHEADKVVTFDFDEAVSFDGFSAPYILYTVARINSLQKKFTGKLNDDTDFALFTEDEVKNLVMKVSDFPEIITKSLENYNSSVIAKYCFDLAKMYNDFYNKYSVLNAESEELVKTRLYLSSKVSEVLTKALGLLTIDVVSEM